MSRRRGGYRGAKPSWTTTSTSGVFGMDDVVELKAAGQWPRGPEAPTNLLATAGNAQVALTWTAPATTHGTITNYIVQYSADGGSTWTTFSDGTSTSTSATVTGLTNGTAYVFRVAAVNHTVGDYAVSAAVAAGAFSPTSIAGLQMWFDASDASTLYDATSGGSLVAADGQVARWQDKSGNGRHATQGSSSRQPTRKAAFRNGLDAIALNNSSLSLPNFTIGAEWNFFIAFSPATATTDVRIVFGSENSANFQWVQLSQTGSFGGGVQSSNNTGWFSLSSGPRPIAAATTGPQVLTWVFDSANGTMYRNTTPLGSAGKGFSTTFGSGASALFSVNHGGNSYADGHAYEVLFYSGTLSANDRASIQSYLMAKWAIT